MNNNIKITSFTLFTTALCNLNCSYCYICKDATNCLKQIDNQIEEDFNNNVQIKQVCDIVDNPDDIEKIILWGGEPFLHMERFIEHGEEFFNTFKNIKSIDSSTNFTAPNTIFYIKQLLNLLENQGKKNNTCYVFGFQISIDGYEEMNDASRGKGVTKKILKNFKELCNIPFNSNYVQMNVDIKPTLSRENFHFLDTPEKCYKWFSFFQTEMYDIFLNRTNDMTFGLSLFNTAAPVEYTKEDGIKYANILKNLQSIKQDVLKLSGWANLYSTVPEAQIALGEYGGYSYKRCSECSRPTCGGGCGAFSFSVVPITNGKYTMCHRGLFDAYVDYHNDIISHEEMNGLSKRFFANEEINWIYDKDDFLLLRETMNNLLISQNQIRYTDYIIFIREYAKAGIIDQKWLNVNEIEKSLIYYLNLSYCLQDSIILTGSWTTMNGSTIPLLYNGAMDIILSELDKNLNEKIERTLY